MHESEKQELLDWLCGDECPPRFDDIPVPGKCSDTATNAPGIPFYEPGISLTELHARILANMDSSPLAKLLAEDGPQDVPAAAAREYAKSAEDQASFDILFDDSPIMDDGFESCLESLHPDYDPWSNSIAYPRPPLPSRRRR